MGLSRVEQETTIRWDRDSQEVSIWSASPVEWRKMARLGILPVKTTTLDGEEAGRFYRVPLAIFRRGLKRKGTGRPGAFGRPVA